MHAHGFEVGQVALVYRHGALLKAAHAVVEEYLVHLKLEFWANPASVAGGQKLMGEGARGCAAVICLDGGKARILALAFHLAN
jgi:hypothetical protein